MCNNCSQLNAHSAKCTLLRTKLSLSSCTHDNESGSARLPNAKRTTLLRPPSALCMRLLEELHQVTDWYMLGVYTWSFPWRLQSDREAVWKPRTEAMQNRPVRIVAEEQPESILGVDCCCAGEMRRDGIGGRYSYKTFGTQRRTPVDHRTAPSSRCHCFSCQWRWWNSSWPCPGW